MFLFKLFFKAIGLLFIVVSISSLIGFFISLLTVGIADAVHFPGLDFADLVYSSTLPLWLVSILALLIAGIPIVFLLLLGLRMVSSRAPVKSIHKVSTIRRLDYCINHTYNLKSKTRLRLQNKCECNRTIRVASN